MVVKTIFVIKHSFGSFEVDSISPVSETANDIRSNRIFRDKFTSVAFLMTITPRPQVVRGLPRLTAWQTVISTNLPEILFSLRWRP